jgi:hypothetical protein
MGTVSEVIMSVRVSMVLLVLLLAPQANAKNKKKQLLPDVVLKAQTVVVVIRPDTGEPLTNPTANRTAVDEVERAISKWGRFRLVMEGQLTDLVIAVRKGHAGGPTISNSPVDNPPVIFQPSDGGVRIGGHTRSQESVPRISNQIGPSEDIFEVYLGGIDHSVDMAPIWRYSAKNALNGPQIEAVEQFRKAIDESEKQRQQQHP